MSVANVVMSSLLYYESQHGRVRSSRYRDMLIHELNDYFDKLVDQHDDYWKFSDFIELYGPEAIKRWEEQ